MSFASGRRLLCPSLVVLMLFSVLQISVGAIRILPANAVAKVKFSHGIGDQKMTKEDLFYKFFNGRTFGPSNRTQKELDETKRRVPSCPDRLHN